MAFDVQGAIKAGYSMDEINQYLATQKQSAPVQPQIQQVQQPQTTAQVPAQSSAIQSILDSILKPFVTTGKNIAGGAFELTRTGLDKAGVKNVYNDPQGNLRENPFLTSNELEQFSTDPMGSLGKQLRASAGVASWAVPFGKGANLLSKVLGPGFAVGALQKASEDNTGVEDVLKGGVGGAATAGLVHGGGKLLEGGANLIGKGVKKVGSMIANDAAQGYGKATPTMFEKAVTEHGFDVNKLIQKYVPKGANYETVLGDVSKRGGGGVIGFKMGQAENTINRAVEGAGATVRVSGDDVIKELMSQKKLLKATVGNERNVAALDAIIEETKKLFKNGMSTKQLLKLKRAADSKFGSAVVDETTGSVAAQAQKVLANFARNKLKQILPTVADALNTETELYTLKPILNKARGTLNTQGSQIRTGAFSGLTDFINPASYYKYAMNNPNISSRLMGGITEAAPKTTSNEVGLLQKALGQNSNDALIGQVSSRIGGSFAKNPSQENSQYNQGGTDSTNYNNSGNDINSQINHESSIPQNDLTGNNTLNNVLQPAVERRIKPEQLMQVLMSPQISAKTKAALKDAYDVQEQAIKEQTTQSKPLAAVTENRVQLAKSGLRALTELESIYKKDSSKVLKAAIPGSLGARDYQSAAYRAVEGLLRARSGAAVPETEVRRYMNANLPQVGDSESDVKGKLAAFRKDLEDVANSGGGSGAEDVLNQILNAGKSN